MTTQIIAKTCQAKLLWIILFSLVVSPSLLSQSTADGAVEVNKELNEVEDTVATLNTSEGEAEEAEPLIAPNVDLSDVAPVPEPITEEPEVVDTILAEEPERSKEEGSDEKSDDITEAKEIAVEQEPVPEEKPEEEHFVILGAEVQPATATRLAWSPGASITGLATPTPVLVINGAKPGPTLCLSSAVHGDELNGIEIVRRVMYDIDPTRLNGKIIGIPIVNLQGFQRGTRYLPDRRDLNRFFPGDPNGSLASRIADSLFKEVISHCDSLVDLHTGSLGRTNLPQIRADMNNPEVAKFTEGFDKMVVVHSPGSPGMLRTAAIQAGIVTVTMEVGEASRIQEDDIRVGANSIYSLMEKQEMLSRRFVWGKPAPIYYASFWLRAQKGGMLFSTADLGDTVYEGQVLGTVTDPITNEASDIVSPMRGRIIGMAVDQVVMPGFAAYHIGRAATEDTIVDPDLPVDDVISEEGGLDEINDSEE